MRPVDLLLAKRFGEAFADRRNGFSGEEIPQFFAKYHGAVPTTKGYLYSVTKAQVFADCLSSLSPENQRHALYDLCDVPPPSLHPMPSVGARKELLANLVEADGRSPLGIELSSLTLYGVRNQWSTAASRLPESSASAITAARSLLESTFKTILVELKETPDTSGDIAVLYKQIRSRLGIVTTQGASQNVHQIVSGLTVCVDGLAGLSNKGGDRHGLVAGARISDLSYAGLAVHSAGTVALFLVRTYKDITRGPT